MRLYLGLLVFLCIAPCADAQAAPKKAAKPAPAPASQGRAIYRSNCAFCHGMAGEGGRGPNLLGALQHGATASDLKRVVLDGVPGTQMPAFASLERGELDPLIAFLIQLRAGGKPMPPIAGDVAKGKIVYQRNACAACHRIGNEGSVYGPDLTRIGGARSAEYLKQSIVDPTADIPDEYSGVTVVTAKGDRITGVRVNEDTFSVQLRDPSQEFRMFRKQDLKETLNETKSLMPAYPNLKPEDLNNLLAYLGSLRGAVKTGAEVKKVEGIR